jgi:F0F1-type ATP synthase assembly protein I
MIITPSTFANDPRIRKQAESAFANGEAVILEGAGSHDQKAISHLTSSPDFQKNVVVGAAVGGTAGVLAGVVVDQITQTHPVVGIVGKLLLGVIGGVVGGAVAKEAAAVARPTPKEKAAPGGSVLNKPAVNIGYDPQTGHLFAQLMQQSTK